VSADPAAPDAPPSDQEKILQSGESPTTASGGDKNILVDSNQNSAKAPGRFNSLRKWFRPWRWMKSKRDGHSQGKENQRKSAEMEDVASAPDGGGVLYGDEFPGSRITTSAGKTPFH